MVSGIIANVKLRRQRTYLPHMRIYWDGIKLIKRKKAHTVRNFFANTLMRVTCDRGEYKGASKYWKVEVPIRRPTPFVPFPWRRTCLEENIANLYLFPDLQRIAGAIA